MRGCAVRPAACAGCNVRSRHRDAAAAMESARLDAACDQAIAACGGDMRSAIRALILAKEWLKLELLVVMRAADRACGALSSEACHDSTARVGD